MGATEAEGLAATKTYDRPIVLVPTLSQPFSEALEADRIVRLSSHSDIAYRHCPLSLAGPKG